MPDHSKGQFLINFCIATVWLINGLFCKVLNLVPRHQEIVARILGEQHAKTLTIIIGIAEILMSVWVVSRIHPRLNAWVQMIIILVMNMIEFMLAPDLLLFGHFNLLFAAFFVILIYGNEFGWKRKTQA